MPPKDKSQNILLWLVAIGFFMEILDSTIINTALPEMARDLNESPLSMHSVVISYTLTLAVFIPVSGWFADRFGIRRVFLSAIIIFTIGSFLCAISQSLHQIVASRLIQGVGGSMLLPIGRLAILRTFPGDQLIRALSFVAVPALVAPLVGPSLGGWLVQYASWHWIFLINIPIGVLGCIATYIAMPEDEILPSGKFDFLGFLLLAGFMISVSLGLEGLSDGEISAALVSVFLVIGFTCLVTYFFHASKKKNSFFTPSLFQVRTYSIGILGNLFARIGSSSMPFLIPLYLQLSLGFSPFNAGLLILPIAIAAIMAKPFVRALVYRHGYRNFLVINTLAVGFSMGVIGFMNLATPVWARIMLLFVFGAVSSMQFTAMNTIALKDLDRKQSTGGNALFSMVQMLAMSFGVAIAGAVLAAFSSYIEVSRGYLDTAVAFRWTFICMGLLTCISSWIFWQLSADIKPKKAELKTV